MADKPNARKPRRQIAKLTKRQIGHNIGQNILSQISNIANSVRDIVDKGHQPGNPGQPLQCSPADIKSSWSPEQLGAIEEFVSLWAIDPEPPPAPPKPRRP